MSEVVHISNLPTPRHRTRPRDVVEPDLPAVQHDDVGDAALPNAEVRSEFRHVEPEAPTQSDAHEYQVGYGQPPKHSQFQKGVSGNRKGRPKGSKNASTIARTFLSRKAFVTVDGQRRKMTALEIGMLQMVKRMTEKGDLKALQYLTALAEGSTISTNRGPTTSGSVPDGNGDITLDKTDREILAFTHREQMLAKGMPPDMVQLALIQLGLVVEDAE